MLFAGSGSFSLSHCLLPAAYPGTGNVIGAPSLVDPDDLDGPDETWGTADDGLGLVFGSPGIDRADDDAAPERDVTGALREAGMKADIGAYEFHPHVIRVRQGATGAGDGSSWADAVPELRNAIQRSRTGDEIWMAAGTYRPTAGTDRTVAFVPRNSTSIYGGFAGSEESRSQRDPAAHVTVLSGDLGGTPEDDTDDSFTIVNMGGILGVTLDGLTFAHARADGTSAARAFGGAIYLEDFGELTVTNCVFEDLYAEDGGAIYCSGSTMRHAGLPLPPLQLPRHGRCGLPRPRFPAAPSSAASSRTTGPTREGSAASTKSMRRRASPIATFGGTPPSTRGAPSA